MLKKLLQHRITVIILAVLGLGALGYLASSMQGFYFTPSQPFSLGGPGKSGAVTEKLPDVKLPFYQQLFFWIFVALLVMAVIAFLDSNMRKKVLWMSVRFVAILLALWWVLQNQVMPRLQGQVGQTAANQAAGSPNVGTTLPVFTPPALSPLALYALSAGVVFGLLALGWFIFARLRRPLPDSSLETIAEIARDTLDGLSISANWDEAIVRCYLRMNEAVRRERGLFRQTGMTPREFAQYLENAGLPAEAIHTLTHLFERVRYGGETSGPQQRAQAIAALHTILQVCGGRP